MRVLHVVYKSGSNSITILAQSFLDRPDVHARIFDCWTTGHRWVFKLLQVAKEYDIVHFHNILAYQAIPLLRLFCPRVKLVNSVHDIGFSYNRQVVGLVKAIMIEVLAIVGTLLVHQTVFVSHAARQKNWLRFITRKYCVIHNGIGDEVGISKDIDWNNKLRLIFIGNHFRIKGLNVLLTLSIPDNTEVHLFGDVTRGASSNEVKTFKDWVKENNIFDHGHVRNEEIARCLRCHPVALLVLSSFEACPVSVIECMQLGVPIIASPLPILNEYGIAEHVQIVDTDPFVLNSAVDAIKRDYIGIQHGMRRAYKSGFTSKRYLSEHIELYSMLRRP